MKDYNGYLFDIDGTLIDTSELIYMCFQKICQDYGKFDPVFSDIAGMIGLPLTTMIETCLNGKNDYEMDQVIKTYKTYQEGIFRKHLKLFPDVNEVLKSLKLKGKKIAAVTARKKESLEPYLEFTGSLQYFDLLVTPEMTSQHKPHPRPAELAMELLEETPETCLFVGDSFFDIHCGQAAGTDTAFVAWSHNDPNKLKTPPNYILHGMKDLISN